jgi:hypothetical protein
LSCVLLGDHQLESADITKESKTIIEELKKKLRAPAVETTAHVGHKLSQCPFGLLSGEKSSVY